MRRAVLAITVVLAVGGVSTETRSGIHDGCISRWWLESPTTPVALLSCPGGDAPSFLDQGWWIKLWIRDINGIGISGIPATDFWLVDCDPSGDVVLCGGRASSNADSATNADGRTTMSLTGLLGGGCADGMQVLAQGVAIEDSLTNCTSVVCRPISLRSPDIDGNFEVNLIDLTLFAESYPPYPYDRCCDFDIDGVVNLRDLVTFALHFGPPGHICP